MNQERNQTILRYLLGELSNAEHEQFEEEYFADPHLFYQLQEARNDLMDIYVRDELPAEQRARFEQYFLASPRRRERVEFAHTLAQEQAAMPVAAAQAAPSPKLSPFGWFTFRPALIFVVAMLLLVCGVLWFLRLQKRSVPEIANNTPVMPSATASLSPTTVVPSLLPTPLSTPSPVQHKPVIATFTLSPVLVRDNDETQLLTIPTPTDIVQLQLEVEARHASRYQARLRTPEGTEILHVRGLLAQTSSKGQRIVLPVAAKLLSRADYIVQLEGAAGGTVDRYYFRVEKK